MSRRRTNQWMERVVDRTRHLDAKRQKSCRRHKRALCPVVVAGSIRIITLLIVGVIRTQFAQQLMIVVGCYAPLQSPLCNLHRGALRSGVSYARVRFALILLQLNASRCHRCVMDTGGELSFEARNRRVEVKYFSCEQRLGDSKRARQ